MSLIKLFAEAAPLYRRALFQFGQIAPDSGPDYFQIDKEILMDCYIAHTPHLCPWEPGMLLDEVRRGACFQVCYGFTYILPLN